MFPISHSSIVGILSFHALRSLWVDFDLYTRRRSFPFPTTSISLELTIQFQNFRALESIVLDAVFANSTAEIIFSDFNCCLFKILLIFDF